MNDFLNSPYNPQNQGGAPASFPNWTEVKTNADGKKTFSKPNYARFKLLLSYKGVASRKGYSVYYSLDYSEKTGKHNEHRGWEKLIKFVMGLHPDEYRVATIFMNHTTDLSTMSRNYNYEMACIRRGEYIRKQDLVFFELDNGNVKVNVQETLKRFA
jgi:hypothetical protein